MTTWNCINRPHALEAQEHFVFVDGAGRVALADHSLRDFYDPASTDDGLLIWDDNIGTFENGCHGTLYLTLTVTRNDGSKGFVWVSPEVAGSIENATGKKVAPATFKVGPFEYHRSRPVPFDDAEFIAETRRWVKEKFGS